MLHQCFGNAIAVGHDGLGTNSPSPQLGMKSLIHLVQQLYVANFGSSHGQLEKFLVEVIFDVPTSTIQSKILIQNTLINQILWSTGSKSYLCNIINTSNFYIRDQQPIVLLLLELPVVMVDVLVIKEYLSHPLETN